jgi:hypothetical protein
VVEVVVLAMLVVVELVDLGQILWVLHRVVVLPQKTG